MKEEIRKLLWEFCHLNFSSYKQSEKYLNQYTKKILDLLNSGKTQRRGQNRG